MSWLACGDTGLTLHSPHADPVRAAVFHTAARPPIGFTIAEIRRITQIHCYDANDVFQRFMSAAKAQGTTSLNLKQFTDELGGLVLGGVSHVGARKCKVQLLGARLFDMFDADNNGVPDHEEEEEE